MTRTLHQNGQIPTDPNLTLALVLGIAYTAGHITTEQALALQSAGGFAELVLYIIRSVRGGR